MSPASSRAISSALTTPPSWAPGSWGRTLAVALHLPQALAGSAAPVIFQAAQLEPATGSDQVASWRRPPRGQKSGYGEQPAS